MPAASDRDILQGNILCRNFNNKRKECIKICDGNEFIVRRILNCVIEFPYDVVVPDYQKENQAAIDIAFETIDAFVARMEEEASNFPCIIQFKDYMEKERKIFLHSFRAQRRGE